LTISKTGRLKIANVIVMKVWNRFAGSHELITGSFARYSHLLIEKAETFTLQAHAKTPVGLF